MNDKSLYLEGEEKFGPLLSAFYSSFTSFSTSRYHRIIADDVLNTQPSSILDVGCGPGNVLSMLSSRDQQIELYGVDPSRSMVSRARKKLGKTTGGSRFHIDEGSSRSIPFRIKFDRIISSFSFHHWKNGIENLPYLTDFLSPNGSITFYEMNSDSYPGRLPLVRKHAMSGEIASRITIKGFVSKADISPDHRLLILRIQRETD